MKNVKAWAVQGHARLTTLDLYSAYFGGFGRFLKAKQEL